MTGNFTFSEVKSLGSQVFIEFLANGNGVGKGFSASIKFGKIINELLQSRTFISIRYLVYAIFIIKKCYEDNCLPYKITI